jgi:hypothetical protein
MLQKSVQGADQPVQVRMKVAPGIDFRGIAKGKISQAVREVGRLWHDGPIDQDRDDGDSSFQSGFDLDPNRVRLVADSRGTVRALTDPPWTNHHDQRIALGQSLPDVLAKIDAERNVVDIHEYRVMAVSGREPVKYPSGDPCGIRSAVGKDQLRHLSIPDVKSGECRSPHKNTSLWSKTRKPAPRPGSARDSRFPRNPIV